MGASYRTGGVRHANSALVTRRPGQSHHLADDSVTVGKAAPAIAPAGMNRINTSSLEAVMGFGRGALLWLLGVPLPIIILLALFMHH